ncbi:MULTISPECIES: hypothetical protein [unclassified Myxococcus]|uniref:hypothetical protein n=1 Tax=unclassified Myxococcus TaxID=2648731 RepID=UPI00157AFA0C|nr:MULTISPECIES: hypothetical protein [unclassified Myxococcus]NTX41432.1 hypothetical protein [Myxococcus sp. CA033]NTX52018.1 hypothetical protein [Myxococcus sp. CA039A]
MSGTVMMRGGLCAVMFAMAGCGEGMEGPPGPQGEPGPSGEQGVPGETQTCDGLYFVDAKGTVAFPVCAPYLIDSQGFTWRFDFESGQPTHEASLPWHSTPLSDLAALVHFETADCTGTAFMTFPIFPRMPFPVLGKYRVRSDDSTWSTHSFRSAWRDDGSCDGFQGRPPVREWEGFPLETERELTPPASFQGPLHIERRP